MLVCSWVEKLDACWEAIEVAAKAGMLVVLLVEKLGGK